MRLARASVVAAVTVALALVAHVLGGGAVPSAMLLGPLAAVVLAAAVLVSGRRIGALGAIALLGVGQLGLHGAFDLLGGMGCAPMAGPAVGHVHATAETVACTTTSVAPVPHSGGSTMLVLHVVATVLAALLIAGTDRALAWIAAWVRPLVALLSPVLVPAFATLPVRVETIRVVARADVGISPDRGPPAAPAHVTLAA